MEPLAIDEPGGAEELGLSGCHGRGDGRANTRIGQEAERVLELGHRRESAVTARTDEHLVAAPVPRHHTYPRRARQTRARATLESQPGQR